MTPIFRVIANGSPLSAEAIGRMRSITVTDEAGYSSDQVEITLADHDIANPIDIPPRGAELRVYLGYQETGLQDMGLFVVDEVELQGWPGEMVIRGRAAPYSTSKGGKSDLQTQKTRSWPKGTKLSAMVAKIAKEHGMEALTSPGVASITLPHLDQTEESDMAFLVRVVRKYDCVVKPGGGKLAVAKRGESKSASGQDMPAITLAAQQCSRWSLSITTRDSEGTVVAFYHDRGLAKRQQVSVGSGDPVRRMRHNFPDRDTALKAAQGELDKRDRRKNKLTLTMPGDPLLAAEAKLTLAGFRAGVPTSWLVNRVEHRMEVGSGYACTLECELPNGGEGA